MEFTFTGAWLLWIVAFLIIGASALFNSTPGDTLSEHVWTWFGTARTTRIPVYRDTTSIIPMRYERLKVAGKAWRWAGPLVLTTFMVWLTAHFATGGLI